MQLAKLLSPNRIGSHAAIAITSINYSLYIYIYIILNSYLYCKVNNGCFLKVLQLNGSINVETSVNPIYIRANTLKSYTKYPNILLSISRTHF